MIAQISCQGTDTVFVVAHSTFNPHFLFNQILIYLGTPLSQKESKTVSYPAIKCSYLIPPHVVKPKGKIVEDAHEMPLLHRKDKGMFVQICPFSLFDLQKHKCKSAGSLKIARTKANMLD